MNIGRIAPRFSAQPLSQPAASVSMPPPIDYGDHGFMPVSGEPPRAPFLLLNGLLASFSITVFTAQMPQEPFVALDMQMVPRACSDSWNHEHLAANKLANLPEVLKKVGKGVLLVGVPEQYYADDIQAIKAFSRKLPPGCFVVLAKTDDFSNGSPDSRHLQTWTTRINGDTYAQQDEGQPLGEILKRLNNTIRHRFPGQG